MNRRLQLLEQLPQAVKDIALSVFSDEINGEIYKEFGVVGIDASNLTTIQTDILVKALPIESLDKEIAVQLKLDAAKAKKIALEIVGKQFLVIDDWMGGAAVKYLKTLGGAPVDFGAFVENFKKQVVAEKAAAVEVAPEIEPQEMVEETEAAETPDLSMEPTTPETDKRDIKNIFQRDVVSLLKGGEWQKKASVNILTIYYLGAEPAFRMELVRVLTNSAEIIGNKTVGEWLKYFVAKVEENDTLSPIKEAQFFTGDKEFLGLDPAGREIVGRLFDLYSNLRNFVEDVSKKPLEDIVIFPFTSEERNQIAKDIASFEGSVQTNEKVGKVVAKKAAIKENVSRFSLNDSRNREAISVEYDLRSSEMRGDKNKNLNYLEAALSSGDNVKILVGLQVATENKVLAEAIDESANFKMIIDGFAKRNGLLADDSAKRLVCFLRGILEDRVGLSQKESAGFGAWIASEFGKQGLFDYAQMAYFDEEENEYHWNI